jgi:nucleotide-binding universal stress UspA family protein
MSSQQFNDVELVADPAPVVVCGLNGSDGSAELARVAQELASSLVGRVEFVHVLNGNTRPSALAMLDALSESSDPGATGRLIELGDPARGIAAVAGSLNANLIVVGDGTASGRLAATAHCPVLIVPWAVQQHVRPGDWWSRTLVCGFDGSQAAWAAAMYAATLAAALHGSITLVSVGAAVPWRMSGVASTLRAKLIESGAFDERLPRPQIHWLLCDGDPACELERVATSTAAPLIAIGSRGMGSLTRRLLRSARHPVVVTPAGP